MYCGKCGSYISENNNFCSKCGTPASSSFKGINTDDYYIIKTESKNVDYTNHSEMHALFANTKDKLILIDLSKCKFIDSVGIGGLVTLVYKTNRTKQEIKFIINSNSILKSIKALGVDNVLDIYETEKEARSSWGLTVI